MDTQRFQAIERVFNAALELPLEQRAAFVSRECGADLEAAERVRAMLATLDADGSDLRAAVEEGAVDWAAESTPQVHRAGAYKLVEELGRGGMGAVYLAERDDEAYEIKVAVKIIRDRLGGGEVVRRFLKERQILAQLNHPGIARLVDGGTTDHGVPFIVMEYVDGPAIDVYADGHRLGVRERLELMLKVCDAVQHAHRNLVVHRDLKPGNILVPEDGSPKLLDFGVAKLLTGDQSEQTRTGLRLMTPAYASPEQMRGEPVTTSTDVYALGLILYELLTGHAPQRIASTDPVEGARRVCDVDPPPPSSMVTSDVPPSETEGVPESTPETVSDARATVPERLRRVLSGDLDAIVLKAVQKRPEDRYASVEMMARDIERYLDRLPVEARSSTPVYRASKFLARNGPGVLAAAAAAAVILGVIGFYTTRLQTERDVAAQEAVKAEQVAGFLAEIFSAGDLNAASGDGGNVTAQDLLDAAAERIHSELADQPDVRSSLMVTLADAYESVGLLEEARALLDSTVVVRLATHGHDHPEVGGAFNELGNLIWTMGDYDSAQVLQERALALRLAGLPAGHDLIAESYNDLGKVLQEKAEYDSADALYARSLQLFRDQPDDARSSVASVLMNRAQMADFRNDREGSVTLNEEAVSIHRILESEGLANDLPVSLHNLAAAYESRAGDGDLDRAEGFYRESIDVVERRAGPDQPANGAAYVALGRLADRRGDLSEAEALYLEGIRLEERFYGPDHPNIAYDLTSLANALRRGDRDAEARQHYLRAIEIVRATLDEASPYRARPIAAYGDLLAQAGDLRGADEHLREALQVADNAVPREHPFRLSIVASLGVLRGKQQQFDEGERLLLEARNLLVAGFGDEDRRARSVTRQLVDLYDAWGRPDQAARYRDQGE